MNIQELHHELDVIENDFYKGVYTPNEIHDLTYAIEKLLKNKQFI